MESKDLSRLIINRVESQEVLDEMTEQGLIGEDELYLVEGPGIPGPQGPAGTDGHSPVITATRSGSNVDIEVDGTTIATISDGEDGQDGAPGEKGDTGPQGPQGTPGLRPVLLYTRDKSALAANTKIPLNLSPYNLVYIEYVTTSNGSVYYSTIIKKGSTGVMGAIANVTTAVALMYVYRTAYPVDDGITFNQGYRKNMNVTSAGTTNDDAANPVRIWGIAADTN